MEIKQIQDACVAFLSVFLVGHLKQAPQNMYFTADLFPLFVQSLIFTALLLQTNTFQCFLQYAEQHILALRYGLIIFQLSHTRTQVLFATFHKHAD